MRKYILFKFIKQNFLILIVATVSVVLRFVNLGYSDFQGDEIKALYLPSENQTFFTFVMDQRKGPVQFFITYLLKFIDPAYNNQFLLRFPFALAGFISVIYFYKFVEIHFGKKIAFYSSLFFSTNGFLVAFSRIIQYQSFVILFMMLCLYFLSLASKSDKYKVKGIYLGFMFWALSLLSHYDGIFIFPMVIFLLYRWMKSKNLLNKSKIKTFVLSSTASSLLVLSFYVPFILSVSNSTKEYWAGRISGSVSEKVSSSQYLFTAYHPIYVVHVYTALLILGLFFIFLGLFSTKLLEIKKLPGLLRNFLTHSTDLMTNFQTEKLKVISFMLWLGVSVSFYEWYVYIPGTHIYTYMIPLFVVLSLGLVTLESVVFKIFEFQLVKAFNFIGVLVIFLFLSAQSYAVYVDHYREYPWEEENFLIWRFPKPNPSYHLSMFGFPYYRDWEGIRNFVESHPDLKAYSTNENRSISRYYINLPKNADKAGFYVYVKAPQSYIEEILNDKVIYWAGKYNPEYTLTRYGRDMVRVYRVEPGTLEEILEKGF